MKKIGAIAIAFIFFTHVWAENKSEVGIVIPPAISSVEVSIGGRITPGAQEFSISKDACTSSTCNAGGNSAFYSVTSMVTGANKASHILETLSPNDAIFLQRLNLIDIFVARYEEIQKNNNTLAAVIRKDPRIYHELFADEMVSKFCLFSSKCPLSSSFPKKTFKILSIDGGGIRGLIPATILRHIESETGKPISQMFDFIAGTSIGGILALGLTAPAVDNGAGNKRPYTAKELQDLFEQNGADIFDPRFSAKGLLRSQYSAAGLEALMLEKFKDIKLSQATTMVMVPALDYVSGRTHFFKSEQAKNHEQPDLEMRQVARATSAAPTYFPPASITGIAPDGGNVTGHYFDGGLFANNPTLCALTEAFTQHADTKQYNFLIVSLGTGDTHRPLLPTQAENAGAIGLIKPILDMLMYGTNQKDDDVVQEVIHKLGGKNQYYRINPSLNEAYAAMDRTDQDGLLALKAAAERKIQELTTDGSMATLINLLKEGNLQEQFVQAISTGTTTTKDPLSNVMLGTTTNGKEPVTRV